MVSISRSSRSNGHQHNDPLVLLRNTKDDFENGLELVGAHSPSRHGLEQEILHRLIAGRQIESTGSVTFTEDGLQARNEYAVLKMPLVISVARQFSRVTYRTSFTHEDLVGYGMIGLFDGLDRLDPERVGKPETYLVWRIRGAIIDALRDVGGVDIRLSRGVVRRLDQIERVENTLWATLGREPTAQEVANAVYEKEVQKFSRKLGHEPTAEEIAQKVVRLTPEAIESARHSRQEILSLDAPSPSLDGERTLAECIPDPHDTTDFIRSLDAVRRAHIIQEIAQGLTREQYAIFSMYTGINSDGSLVEPRGMKEIGEILGKSESRISQEWSPIKIKLLRNPLFGEILDF